MAKVVELFGGGSVINGAYPVFFLNSNHSNSLLVPRLGKKDGKTNLLIFGHCPKRWGGTMGCHPMLIENANFVTNALKGDISTVIVQT